MDNIEQTCSECSTINLVPKSYNCNSCGVWNKFVIIEEVKTKKGSNKKWLS